MIIVDDVIRDLGIEIEPFEDESSVLDSDEKTVLASIRKRCGATPDEIAADSELTAARVNSIVTVMEIKGLVESYAGRIFPSEGL